VATSALRQRGRSVDVVDVSASRAAPGMPEPVGTWTLARRGEWPRSELVCRHELGIGGQFATVVLDAAAEQPLQFDVLAGLVLECDVPAQVVARAVVDRPVVYH